MTPHAYIDGLILSLRRARTMESISFDTEFLLVDGINVARNSKYDWLAVFVRVALLLRQFAALDDATRLRDNVVWIHDGPVRWEHQCLERNALGFVRAKHTAGWKVPRTVLLSSDPRSAVFPRSCRCAESPDIGIDVAYIDPDTNHGHPFCLPGAGVFSDYDPEWQ